MYDTKGYFNFDKWPDRYGAGSWSSLTIHQYIIDQASKCLDPLPTIKLSEVNAREPRLSRNKTKSISE